MSFHRIKIVLFALVLLTAISCKVTKYGCQIPCNTRDGKEIKYFFGAYYNTQGKMTYKLYVSDSTYNAPAQADFDAFKGAILNKSIIK